MGKISICVYARIKKKCIDEDYLERILVEFFLPKSGIIKKMEKNCVTYDGISSENKVTIFFVSKKNPPYNVYDSNIINTEFEYVQLIMFDIKKEEATTDFFKEMINFCIFLKQKIDSDILVTSDVHDEICLLKEKDIIWSENLSVDYYKNYFRL